MKQKQKTIPVWVYTSAFFIFLISLVTTINELPVAVDTFYAAGMLSFSVTLGIVSFYGLKALSRSI